MAASVTNPWSKPGAWALDSEEHEEDLKQEAPATNGHSPAAPMADFPDLMTAAATKTKKKKAQTVSLGEFVTGSSANKGLTTEDMMMLPTGPRQRTAEELDRTKLGGGFRSYGDRGSESRWGSGRVGGGDDEGRRPNRDREPLGPSRADVSDDWGAVKKSSVGGAGGGGGGFDRRERGAGGFFEGSHSRADESDSWASNKPRNGGFERGFDKERRMGFESSGGADSSDNWGKKKETDGRRFAAAAATGGGAFDSLRERRAGNESSDADTWGKKRDEVTARPRLNLQPRKLPVGGEGVVGGGGVVGKGVSNPFGDARPREEVLKEKGEDWKEIDEKLEAMKMKDLGSGDGSRSGFGRARSNEDSTERSWRKNQDTEVHPPSPSKIDNGQSEEPEAKDP